MIGNLSAAVDCCLEAGLMAEALLLAQVSPVWAALCLFVRVRMCV